MQKCRIILGSSSNARVKMLEKIGCYPDEIFSPDIDETPLARELPKDTAMRLALAKAKKVHGSFPNDIVISADTVCCVGRLALPKALTEDEVKFCLNKISGRRHRVYTGICGIRGDKIMLKLGMTIVQFKRLTPKEINNFIADKKQWCGKAGGYTLMGAAGGFVKMIRGDDTSNVIGLPLYHTRNILTALGEQLGNNTVL
jgi:septum formation protein